MIYRGPGFLDVVWFGSYTDKEENQIFLIYKEIKGGAVAKSYMTNGLLIYGEIFAHFLIYLEALPHIWLCNSPAPLWISLYMRKIWFSFLSVYPISPHPHPPNLISKLDRSHTFRKTETEREHAYGRGGWGVGEEPKAYDGEKPGQWGHVYINHSILSGL